MNSVKFQRTTVTNFVYKFILFCLFLILFISSVAFPAGKDSEKEYLSRVQRLGAIKVMKDAISHLGDLSLISLKTLKKHMIDHPETHKQIKQSQNALEKWFEEQQKAILEKKQQESYNKFSEGGKLFNYSWLKEYVDRELRPSIEQTIRNNRDKKFMPAFHEARAQAVQEQWQDVKRGIYPEPEDVQAIAEKGDSYRKKVSERLNADMAGKLTLFEENTNRVEETITEVMKDALSQLIGQQEVLRKAKAEGFFIENDISNSLRQEILKYVNTQKPKTGQRIYGIFPSMEKKIPVRAKELVEGRFKEYIQSEETNPLIDKQAIKITIEKAPSKHKTLEKSLELLRSQLLPKFQTDIENSYWRKVGKNDPNFKNWIQTFLIKDREGINTLREKLKSRIEALSPSVRKEIALQQITQQFPLIYTGQWEVPENIIKKRYETEHYSIDISEASKLLNIKNFEKIDQTLLDEARHELSKSIEDSLKKGHLCLTDQISITRSMKEGIQKNIEETSNQKVKYDVQHWVKEYIERFQPKWQKKREEYQPPIGPRYANLFEYTRETMEDFVKNHIKELEDKKREEDKKKREEIIEVKKPVPVPGMASPTPKEYQEHPGRGESGKGENEGEGKGSGGGTGGGSGGGTGTGTGSGINGGGGSTGNCKAAMNRIQELERKLESKDRTSWSLWFLMAGCLLVGGLVGRRIKT